MVERHRSEQTFLLEAGHETVPVRTRMIGDHHVTNCLLAAAVGLIYGVDLAAVVRGLEKVEQVPGRLERIECGQPFSVFVDYARTPDTLAAGLASAGRFAEAIAVASEAERLARDRGDDAIALEIAERTRLYRVGQPYLERVIPATKSSAESN